MDPLSDVLSLLKLRSYVSGGFEAGGDWSVQFGPQDGIKCYAVVSGECWLTADNLPEPVRIRTGDCFLLPKGRPFRIASDLALTPVDAATIYRDKSDGGITSMNGGGDFFCVGGRFAVTGDRNGALLGVLPPIVHLRTETDRAAMRWCLERMRQELRDPQPGSFLVAQQLATMMLVQALRLHLSEQGGNGVGWLFALADKQMRAAITAIHRDPASRWTVQAMAEHAAMSRTSFTLKFKQAVGEAPMEYLTRWRMMLASDRLANPGDSIATIALSLGYDSESAFSTAFKRVMGCSPRKYNQGQSA
jgi:AraC-like DNA-binding protein